MIRLKFVHKKNKSELREIKDLAKKIKLIIRKAYEFRNIYNMIDMVPLACSRIRIPLPNRKLESYQMALALE